LGKAYTYLRMPKAKAPSATVVSGEIGDPEATPSSATVSATEELKKTSKAKGWFRQEKFDQESVQKSFCKETCDQENRFPEGFDQENNCEKGFGQDHGDQEFVKGINQESLHGHNFNQEKSGAKGLVKVTAGGPMNFMCYIRS